MIFFGNTLIFLASELFLFFGILYVLLVGSIFSQMLWRNLAKSNSISLISFLSKLTIFFSLLLLIPKGLTGTLLYASILFDPLVETIRLILGLFGFLFYFSSIFLVRTLVLYI